MLDWDGRLVPDSVWAGVFTSVDVHATLVGNFSVLAEKPLLPRFLPRPECPMEPVSSMTLDWSPCWLDIELDEGTPWTVLIPSPAHAAMEVSEGVGPALAFKSLGLGTPLMMMLLMRKMLMVDG